MNLEEAEEAFYNMIVISKFMTIVGDIVRQSIKKASKVEVYETERMNIVVHLN